MERAIANALGDDPEKYQFVNHSLKKRRQPDRQRPGRGLRRPRGLAGPRFVQGARLPSPPRRITISKNDVVAPSDKEEILERYESETEEIMSQYDEGYITAEERKEAVTSSWDSATEEVGQAMEDNLDELNPIYMMANSGARGSFKQIRQLAGMRGLMANPKGEIIERPIKANFMEGLSVLGTSSRRAAPGRDLPTPRCGRRTRATSPGAWSTSRRT